MTADEVHDEVAAWRAVAADPARLDEPAAMISGRHPGGDEVIIRLGITRQHAQHLLGTEDLQGVDALVLSASCWNATSGEQVETDDTLFLAHIHKLLSRDHALASFEADLAPESRTHYRMVLIGKDQKPIVTQPAGATDAFGVRRPNA